MCRDDLLFPELIPYSQPAPPAFPPGSSQRDRVWMIGLALLEGREGGLYGEREIFRGTPACCTVIYWLREGGVHRGTPSRDQDLETCQCYSSTLIGQYSCSLPRNSPSLSFLLWYITNAEWSLPLALMKGQEEI